MVDAENKTPLKKETEKPKKSLLIVLFSVILLVMGEAFFATRLQPAMESLDSSVWAETEGTVVSSQLASSCNGRTDACIWTYEPEIRYKYTVDGKNYTSNRVYALVSGNVEKEYNQKIVDAHPKNSPVVVYYKKGEPAYSLLIKGESGGLASVMVGLGIPFIVFLAGLYGIIWYFRK